MALMRAATSSTRRWPAQGTRQIRPDWDLAVPGLRGNSDADDHSMRHPCQQGDYMKTVTSMTVREN
jgi:hypothetical protein